MSSKDEDCKGSSNSSLLVNLQFYSLSEIILASSAVVQEISLVVIFLEAFYILKFNDQQSIYFWVTILTAILYPLLVVLSHSTKGKKMISFHLI